MDISQCPEQGMNSGMEQLCFMFLVSRPPGDLLLGHAAQTQMSDDIYVVEASPQQAITSSAYSSLPENARTTEKIC